MKRIATAVVTALLIGGVLGLSVGIVTAATDTTTVDGVTNTTVTNATTFNATYNISDLNSSSSKVVSTDTANNTADVNITLGSTTVTNTLTWSDGADTTTVDVTSSANYPSSISSETINVTADQSVTKIAVDGNELYPNNALGIGGTGGNTKLLLAIALVVGALIYRD